MMTPDDAETFATQVIEEVRRWPGVEMRAHAGPHPSGETDGVEFRLYGRQIGHIHNDCEVHLSLTKALKQMIVGERLAEPLTIAPTSGWAMFTPTMASDSERAIWLLRLNYIRLRRQRLTPHAAAASPLVQQHEAALGNLSPDVAKVLHKTQVRSRPRPLPSLEA
jgi:hypothetical protein